MYPQFLALLFVGGLTHPVVALCELQDGSK